MVAQSRSASLTSETYLDQEQKNEFKTEYHDGFLVNMSGASQNHSRISSSIAGLLYSKLAGSKCEGFVGEMRVRSEQSNCYFYPDYTVVCGAPEFERVRGVDSLLNPTIVFEVLSNSTEAYDRGYKWLTYKHIESLQAYVLVHQNEPIIELFTRMDSPETWLYSEIVGVDAMLPLQVANCELALRLIFENVDFDVPETVTEVEG